ncbi:MAG: sigma-70 family RNA polymerase sigma factor [Acidobacteria bacterium]|nr:sigma-70 family RNA polymerase sigma factor [Acidobacteriota bacterium]
MTAAALDSLAEERARYVAFVERRVSSRAVAEDIVQEAFVRSLERGGAIRSDESVVAWFYRVLRNAVIDHYRRAGTSAAALAEWARQLDREEAPGPAAEREICACLLAGLGSLKAGYREALETVDMEGQPLAALAARAKITEANAAVRVHRARAALRKRLHDCCQGCAACTCEE